MPDNLPQRRRARLALPVAIHPQNMKNRDAEFLSGLQQQNGFLHGRTPDDVQRKPGTEV
jgi:hypothetical protein